MVYYPARFMRDKETNSDEIYKGREYFGIIFWIQSEISEIYGR